MHLVSAKDKDLTVIRIPYRTIFIQTHERRTKNITIVGTWLYFNDFHSVNELLHISPNYCCSACCVSLFQRPDLVCSKTRVHFVYSLFVRLMNCQLVKSTGSEFHC